MQTHAQPGDRVGRRFWEPNKKLSIEYGMKEGLIHGIFREWWPNGVLAHESNYVNGKDMG